jgi:hypothetical protein
LRLPSEPAQHRPERLAATHCCTRVVPTSSATPTGDGEDQ